MSHDLDNEFADLARELRASRPTPEPEFTERLDQAVDDHFPPDWADEAALGKQGKGGIGSLAERFRRRIDGNRILLPAMAGFAGLLFVVAVVGTAMDSDRFGSGGGSDGGDEVASVSQGDAGTADSSSSRLKEFSDSVQNMSGGAAAAPSAGGVEVLEEIGKKKSYIRAGTRLGPQFGAILGSDAAYDVGGPVVTKMGGSRDVAREAEITLGTDPSGVQDVANEVVSVTDDHNGIVMDSKVVDGKKGTAGASFSLLIPSAQIESAVADLSGIADLRSRSQELTDITAPTNNAQDDIADSEAKIKSLLGELEETYDEDERASLEQRIRWERNTKRWAENRLNRLERRADYTPVGLRVETGGDTSSDEESSSWGLGDAVDDAGKLLGVAAGVTVIALAIAIPIGIVVLIALAMNRAWVRRSRRRALGDE